MTSHHRSTSVAYLRRSTKDQEDSLILQLNWALKRSMSEQETLDADESLFDAMMNNDLAESRGLFIDNGISGSQMIRPGLNALLGRLKSEPSIGTVYCFNVDRLSRFRNALKGAALVDEILGYGVRIITKTRVIEPSQDRTEQLVNAITSVTEAHANAQFSYNLGHRVLQAHTEMAAKGFRTGGQPTYGFARFLVDKTTGKPIQQLKPGERRKLPGHAIATAPGEDPESLKKLEVVRLIHDLYHSGMGIGAIANELNNRNIPPPHKGRKRKGKTVSSEWNVGTIRNILENPTYIGQIPWGRTAQGSHVRYEPDGNSNARELPDEEPIEVRRKIEEWHLTDAIIDYENVVPTDLWDANYKRLKERGEKSGQRGQSKTRKHSPFPVGDIICASCGKKMVATKIESIPGFMCSTYQRSPKDCTRNYVYRDQVLWFIAETLRRACNTAQSKIRTKLEAAIAKKLSVITNTDSSEQDVERLTNERETAEKYLEKAMGQKIEYDEPVLIKAADKKVRQYGKQIRDIDRQLKRIDKARSLQKSDLSKEVDAALSVLDNWSLLTDSTTSKRLQRLLGVLKPTITIHFDHKPGQRPKYQPREAEISFEPDTTAGDVRGHMLSDGGTAVTPVANRVSAGRKTTVTKGNRGDRI